MKRFYILLLLSIILFFILGSILAITVYNYANNNKSDNIANLEVNDINHSEDDMQIVTTSYTNIKVMPNAKLIFYTNYEGCNHTIKEEKNASDEIINKTENDIATMYSDWDLKKFSSDEVILYKEAKGFCDNDYIIKEKDGNICIFKIDDEGKEMLYKDTSIQTQYLPEQDLLKMKDGINVNGLENLNKIIEDFE